MRNVRVFSHKGIAVRPHDEVNHDSRREDQNHTGYEWVSCVRCGVEFIKGRWFEVDTCGHPNCGKVAV